MKKINTIKTRIIIFETLRPAYQNLLKSVNEDYYEVVAVVNNESSYDSPHFVPLVSFEQILDFNFWDLLIINDEAFEKDIQEILALLNIPEERYFFLRKTFNKDEIIFYRNFFSRGSQNGKVLEFSYRRLGENYFAITTMGGDYITHALDCVISENMFRKRESYSQGEIDTFIELAEQYYGIGRKEKGFFFDIGANIGTTCIYAKKYLVPNMTIVAFEPIYRNYKLLLANIIINDITDYIAVNKAVSDRSGSCIANYDETNPGGSCIVQEDADTSDLNGQLVDSLTVDEFLVQNHIDPADVRCVWIDTEGFEANVLRGAESLLRQEKVAVYMEYAPMITDVGQLAVVADICSQYFKSFICIDDFFAGDIQARPIEDLYGLYKRCPGVTNIFLIK